MMKLLAKIAFIFLLCLVCFPVLNGQGTPGTDSLLSLLQNAGPKEQYDLFVSLSENRSLDLEDRLEYIDNAVKLASSEDNIAKHVDALLQKGWIYYEFDVFEDAIKAFETAYSISEESDYGEGMAGALIRLGRVNGYIGEMEKAVGYFNQAVDIADENKNPNFKARALLRMGDLYRRNSEYTAALEYYTSAQKIVEEMEDHELLATIMNNEGSVLYEQGAFQQAIECFEQAAAIYTSSADSLQAGLTFLRLGNTHFQTADYDIALSYLQRALKIFENEDYPAGIFAVTNTMGAIYSTQELYERALEVHLKNLQKSRELDATLQIANSCDNLGTVYNQLASDSLKSLFGTYFVDSIGVEPSDIYLNLFDDALTYYNEALEIWQETGRIFEAVGTSMNIGIIYVHSGKPAMALEPLEKALELNEGLNNHARKSNIMLWLGQVYLAFGNYGMAQEYMDESLELALETNFKDVIKYDYLMLSRVYEKRGDLAQALKYYKLYFDTNDQMTQEDRRKVIADMQVKYETEATQKENALLMAESKLADAKLKQNRIVLIITFIAIGVFIVMMLQLIRQNNLKKKANRELEKKNALITEQKKEITDSIQYASRIQNAMLPPGDYVDSLMPDRFILYMPRDIVSGDYYYITEKGGKIICVAADCTGHGVPGAFMSMLGIAYLNEIISKHTELHTDEILGELRNHVIKSLHQTGKEGESQDGMDLAIYILDRETNKLEFSGANNSLLIYRNGELIEAKADKMPIGIHTRYQEPFTRHNLNLQKGDMLYTFSDGYPDLFGGPKHKKFMIKNFKRMLMDIHMKPMKEQYHIMQKVLSDWMADTAQVDDILVIGVRV